MLSNAYFLAKFRFDTAENEPAQSLQNLKILQTLPIGLGHDGERGRLRVASAIRERRARLGLRLPRVITRWNNEMITFFLKHSQTVEKYRSRFLAIPVCFAAF